MAGPRLLDTEITTKAHNRARAGRHAPPQGKAKRTGTWNRRAPGSLAFVAPAVTWAAKCQTGGADVLAAVPGFHCGMPLARERRQQRRGVAARGVDREVDVFQRLLQRELGGEVTPVHLVELGVGERRVQRAALDDLRELLVADPEAIS